MKKILNAWIKKSPWYTEGELRDCKKFWDGVPYNLDVINLGSNSAKYGFCYDNLSVNAFNMAMGPQCLLMDYNILQYYSDHLKQGATVIIPLCPFSSMAGYNYLIDSKYHTFLPKERIPNYNKKTLAKIENLRNSPLSTYPLMRCIVDVKNLLLRPLRRKRSEEVNMEVNADNWIKAWKNEFEIVSFADTLSSENSKNRNDSALILHDIVAFCLSKGFKPTVVLPPVSENLLKRMDDSMRKNYIVDYIAMAKLPDDVFLDYLYSPEISHNSDLFSNAYFLNAEGAKVFTKLLLNKLEII